MAFNLLVYAAMNLGAFWVVIVVVNRTGSAELDGFRGVAVRSWGLAAAMFVFLIALTGLPPTAGFVAKLNLFKVVVDAGLNHLHAGFMTGMATFYLGLALLGVLNSAVSLYYYMKIVKAMVFDKADETAPAFKPCWAELALAGAMAIILIALIDFDPLMKLVGASLNRVDRVVVIRWIRRNRWRRSRGPSPGNIIRWPLTC